MSLKAPLEIGTDRGAPIPAQRLLDERYGPCEFCGGRKHFGWCDEMRDYNEFVSKLNPPQPRVVPLTRSGPTTTTDIRLNDSPTALSSDFVNVPYEDPYAGLNRQQRRKAMAVERRAFRKSGWKRP